MPLKFVVRRSEEPIDTSLLARLLAGMALREDAATSQTGTCAPVGDEATDRGNAGVRGLSPLYTLQSNEQD